MSSDLDKYAPDLLNVRNDSDSSFCYHRQIAKLAQCEIISEEEVKRLCIKAREIFIEEGNVQNVDSPVTVSI
jgi:hypothetical protein